MIKGLAVENGISGIGISEMIDGDMVTVVMENGDSRLQGNLPLRETNVFLPHDVHIPPWPMLLPLRIRPTTLLHGDHYKLLNRLLVITAHQLAYVACHRTMIHRDLPPRNGKMASKEEKVLIMESDRGRIWHRHIAALLVLCRSARILVPLPGLAHLHPPIIHNPVLIPIPKHRLTHTLRHNHIGKGHCPPQ